MGAPVLFFFIVMEKPTASVQSGAARPEPVTQVRCFREGGEGQGEVDSVPRRQGRGEGRPGQGWGEATVLGVDTGWLLSSSPNVPVEGRLSPGGTPMGKWVSSLCCRE